MIYIFRPTINNEQIKSKYEDRIRELTDAGIQVVVEPNADERFHLFGVSNITEKVESRLQCKTNNAPFSVRDLERLDLSRFHTVESLYHLDSAYVSFTQKEGRIKNAVMGSKNVGTGKVIFIGGELTQNLSAIYVNAFGKEKFEQEGKQNSKYVQDTWENMFDAFGVEENFLPAHFSEVTYQNFTYNGGEIDYASNETQDVVISITYSPRWKITIDDKEIPVDVDENLIRVTLPKGSHVIKMEYGVTPYGVLGYVITFVTLLLFVAFAIKFSHFEKLVAKGIEKSQNKLQFEKGNP